VERNGKKLGRVPIGITIQIEDSSPGLRTPRCGLRRLATRISLSVAKTKVSIQGLAQKIVLKIQLIPGRSLGRL